MPHTTSRERNSNHALPSPHFSLIRVNHFLHGQVGGMFAPDMDKEESYNPKKRWRRIQELARHFWRRWMTEWVPSLSGRKKWFKERKNLQVGDVVLLVYSKPLIQNSYHCLLLNLAGW